MTEEQARLLALPFTFEEIEWRVLRVSKKKPVAQVAAYVDSRAIQKRLDEVVGRENWQNEFVTIGKFLLKKIISDIIVLKLRITF